MLAEKNESIKKSIVTLKELTADEKAKMQMEARERYRRDLVAALDFVREEKEEEIKELKNTIDEQKKDLQQSYVENAELQKEKDAMQKEMSERIRFLEEQLAKAQK